jgi:hypothetical protein
VRPFIDHVAKWLSTGWAPFFAGLTYAAVRLDAVKNWLRLVNMAPYETMQF